MKEQLTRKRENGQEKKRMIQNHILILNFLCRLIVTTYVAN